MQTHQEIQMSIPTVNIITLLRMVLLWTVQEEEEEAN